MTSDLFASRPWIESPAPIDDSVVGMLGQHEAALFYHLARSYWRGEGTIVDAGSFLGKSARCFAAGVRANPKLGPTTRIHCFDDFRCHDLLTVNLVREGFGDEIAIGDSTQTYFDRQVAGDAELLEVHAGDFHDAEWQNGPIEILMVDIAKSPSLGSRVVEQFFPHLTVGRSLVVHQDYHHVWLPHIHVAMEYLADSFELVVPRADDTAAFRLVAELDPDRMRRIIANDFIADERVELMGRAIDRLPTDKRFVVQLARLNLLAELERFDDMRHGLADVRAVQPSQLSPNEATALRTIEDILDMHDIADVYARGDHERALAVVDRVLAREATPRAHAFRAVILANRDAGADAAVAARAEAERTAPPELRHTLMGQTELRFGLVDAAQATVRQQLQAISADSLPANLCDLLVAVWKRRPPTADADELLEDLGQRFVTDAEVDWLRARLAFLREDAAAAFAHARAGLDRGGETRRAVDLLASFQLTPAAVRAATSN
ncbi:MAG: hypothetical protein NXI31_04705 [bacterium]|nr:hypothetical protein [bacterium]